MRSFAVPAFVVAAVVVGGMGALPDNSQRKALIGSEWVAEYIGEAGVIDDARTWLMIADDGSVSGSGGCNHMSGSAKIKRDKLTFGPLAATEMGCVPAVMDQEARFFTALGTVARFRITVEGKLELVDSNGNIAVSLSK